VFAERKGGSGDRSNILKAFKTAVGWLESLGRVEVVARDGEVRRAAPAGERGGMTLAPTRQQVPRGNGDDGKHYWLTPPDTFRCMPVQVQFDLDVRIRASMISTA
jgi:hypothetical protein